MRNKLNAIAESKGYGISDNDIVELLREQKSLKEYGRDKHRWYTLFKRVVKLMDIFVEFTDITNFGDEPALDEEEINNLVLSSMKQVYPKEVTIVDYVDIL